MSAINLGFISFTVWPALVIISIIIGSIVTLLAAKKHKGNAGGALIVFLLAGLVAGRVAFVIGNLDSFEEASQIFNIFDGRINYIAALVTCVIVFLFQQYKNEKSIALRNGVFTMLGTYVSLSFLIAVASSHAVLPESDFLSIEGKAVKLHDISQQRPVVMNLWAISCDACLREAPLLVAAEKSYSDIAFIYMNQREPLERVQRFIQEKNLELEHVLIDSKGEIAENKGIFSFPVTLFFDAQGQLVYSHSGELTEANLQGAIEEYL